MSAAASGLRRASLRKGAGAGPMSGSRGGEAEASEHPACPRSVTYLVKFFSKYFILFYAIVNEMDFLNFILCIEMQLISVCWFCILQFC